MAEELNQQIAQHCFGWTWRDDWQAWCPPGWPAITVADPLWREKAAALEAHGGRLYGHTGGTDARGRPVIPQYVYDPAATEILWQWLHHQPGVQLLRFVPLAVPPGSRQGVRPWRCEILLTPERRVVTGEGDTHKEALCRAVLALCTAAREQGPA